jgi:hypothetical protein
VYTENAVRIDLAEESLTVRKRRSDELLEYLRSLVGQPHSLRTSSTLIRSRAPNRIPNVFGLNEPQHMVSKPYFEIMKLMDSLSVWTKSREFPEPLFIAFNTAVTAWHITDWLWESRESTRAAMKKRFGFDYNEWSQRGRNTGLHTFQNAVVADRRSIYICREIANASKDMRRKKIDPAN